MWSLKLSFDLGDRGFGVEDPGIHGSEVFFCSRGIWGFCCWVSGLVVVWLRNDIWEDVVGGVFFIDSQVMF